MTKFSNLKLGLAAGVSVFALAGAAHAEIFDIPAGDLKTALSAYTAQVGIQLIVAQDVVEHAHTQGAHGNMSARAALGRILAGTGYTMRDTPSGAVGIVRQISDKPAARQRLQVAEAVAAHAAASVETVVVTSSKIKGDIQTVPIAITALSQEQLTSRQIAGGPDLVKEVPNLTFSKTNFTGYNIQIRGIGTQAISVTTDPAVAVAMNDIPFIRNHFFEQEFYDLSQVEVLRGPQGTLYGRNATAGVVNVIPAKPTDQFEAMLSGEAGNYNSRRFEGMVNIPIVDDRVGLRIAGEWTRRDGYSFNDITSSPIDGRDLWSTRVTLGIKPFADLQTYLVWEHFQENDDRLRSSKQLCKTDPGPTTVNGVPVPQVGQILEFGITYLSQGCLPASLYSADAFEVPNGYSLPYWSGPAFNGVMSGVNPYGSTTQSRNLRVIESTINPSYRAKNDTLEFNADYRIGPSLTLSAQTGYNKDFLYSTEDYNRFNTSPDVFAVPDPRYDTMHLITQDGKFCDPQLGCSDRLVAEDLSDETAWQFNQELRLTSNYDGPFNFSVGANYLHYETEENYYVFINALTAFSFAEGNNAPTYIPGVTDNHECLQFYGGYNYQDPLLGGGEPDVNACTYIDPNPLNHINNRGHNYFLSQNPYTLNSYAGFGEVYYNVTPDLKLIGGARWTDDEKHFIDIPSELLARGWGYPSTGVVDQKWNEWTGRAAANWTPKLDFTDQTLIYGSFAHGYKAGGANPPGAVLLSFGASDLGTAIHPLTFKPEFIDAYELGTKNTLLDGALTLNGTVFFYNYKQYQISEIVDRTSVNLNFDATVKGAELETTWEPAPGLKFSFAGGYEKTRLAKGSKSIDLIDRTAGTPGWMVVKPSPTQASNCIFPVEEVGWLIQYGAAAGGEPNPATLACGTAYTEGFDPITAKPYSSTIAPAYAIPDGYPGYDPSTAPNDGEGFDKDLSGNELPNAPHFTTSVTAEYTVPVSENWAATVHGDFYWQSQSWARVFNDRPYDKIRGYSNLNLAFIVTGANGLQVMGYLKNVFDTTAITGDFLNSDDSGLTTNVFLTDPRLYGIRITKNF